MPADEKEKTIEIGIIDNNEWQPDIDFTVELYDLEADGNPKLHGDDTSSKITIIDEDFPGKLTFTEDEIPVRDNAEFVEITINRIEGSDGKISCKVKTLEIENEAKESQHFEPLDIDVEFEAGETIKTLKVKLLKPTAKPEGDEEEMEKKFRVVIESALPEGVKISRKRNVIVSIIPEGQDEVFKQQRDHIKLVEFYMKQRKPSWGQLFKNSV